MRDSIIISLLLGAGALGHPHYKLNNPLAHIHRHKRDHQPDKVEKFVENGRVVVNDIFFQTVYQNGAPAPSPAAKADIVKPPVVYVTAAPVAAHEDYSRPKHEHKQFEHQQAEHKKVQQPKKPEVHPQVQQVKQVEPVKQVVTPPKKVVAPPAKPVQPSTGGSNDGSPMSGHKSYLQTANYFRKLQGFPEFEYDDTLQGNSATTNNADGAVKMAHQLNAGSNAQCIAQGDDTTTSGDLTPFDLVYLGWLCEIPQDNLGDMCDKMKAATHMQMNYQDPGHANILRSTSYKTIGCNYKTSVTPQPNFQGMWTCDLGL
ncbi:hypothetical protein MMC21_001752 [Puttea exsequens]|nr:hypothetical protein [Puttea exsequens]